MAKGDFETTIWRFGNGNSRNRGITINQDVRNISSPVKIRRRGLPGELVVKPPVSTSTSINFLRWMTFGDQYVLLLETRMPPNMDPKCTRRVYVIDTLPGHRLKKIEIAKHTRASEPYVSYRKLNGDIFLIYMADSLVVARNLAFHRSDNGMVICPQQAKAPELVGGRSIIGNYNSMNNLLSMQWLNPVPGLPPLPGPCTYLFTPGL